MKKGILTLMALVAAFFLLWAIKVATPINRPRDVSASQGGAWFQKTYTVDTGSLEDWILDSAIPSDHIPMPGVDGVYMVIDAGGNVVSYERCTRDADGTLHWEKASVDGGNVSALGNGVYQVADEGADGGFRYVKYVRNEDDSYAYVETDKDGVPTDIGADATEVPSNYVPVGNGVYALYNPQGVMTGYRTRMRDASGGLVWQQAAAPSSARPQASGDGFGVGIIAAPTAAALPSADAGDARGGVYVSGTAAAGSQTEPSYETGADGTTIRRETREHVETRDGIRTTYVTTVTTVYAADGSVISTHADEPQVKSTEDVRGAATPDRGLIASTLDNELARVFGQASFDEAMAREVLAQVNAERVSAGLPQLTMDAGSAVYKAAMLKAADMAIYDYATDDSAMYGTIRDLFARFGVSGGPSINVMKMSEASAAAISARFDSDEGAHATRMRGDYTVCGVAIAKARGVWYIAEVYA